MAAGHSYGEFVALYAAGVMTLEELLTASEARGRFMIEAAAGLLDNELPEARIRAEAEEEIGYRLGEVRKIFEAFMSPGAVTEKLYFFVAEYDATMRIGSGGGIAEEGEDIEVLELPIEQALAMIDDGRIVDAKTIILLQYAALNNFK